MASHSTRLFMEVNNINNNGANCFAPITQPMIITGINLDCAYMPSPTSPLPSGNEFAEVWIDVAVTSGVPTFNKQPAWVNRAYPNPSPTNGIGATSVYNPAGTSMAAIITGERELVSMILKCWVNSNGIASTTGRNASVSGLAIPANPGDYLLLHADHGGWIGDFELQGVLYFNM